MYYLLLFITLMPLISFSQPINFETNIPNNWSTSSGGLNISSAHYKLGTESLVWNWTGQDTVTINAPNINSGHVLNFYNHTTELWIYNETSSSQSIRFEYLDVNNVVNYHYDFYLNFEGWRRVSRSYKYDMHAIPGSTTNINKIRILSPTTGSGQLYFDDWEYTKTRYKRIRSHQMPDVGGYYSDSSYWVMDNYTPNIPLIPPTASELTDLATIRTAILTDFRGASPTINQLQNANNFYTSLNIAITGNQIKGKHTTPQDANTHLLVLAKDYIHNGTASSLQKAKKIIWLVNDAGFAGGSDLVYGWYFTRDYFTSLILLYNALDPVLQNKVYAAIAWTLHMGEMWDTVGGTGWDSDFIHTNLRFELGAIAVCINNDTVAVRELKGFKQFLERKNIPTSSTQGWLKPDHTAFHHKSHYYGYMYSFNSYTTVLGYLDNTQFQINQTAYEQFRDAAYAFLIFCNGNHYANSLSGRHPFSTNLVMEKQAYNQLAYIGGNILGQTADSLIAGAYNRIWNDDIGLGGYPSESFPTGYWQFNYSPVGIYRQDNWVATIHGINQNFWGTETYSSENRYGRYQSYGAVEIMYPGGRDSSGMNINGFDWNKNPGTTSKVLPWTALNPSNGRIDERAKSDYAAALRFWGDTDELKGAYGMYGFNFQQKGISSTHDETFRFKKSMFCFDGIIINLGSNISSTDGNNPIITTLLQNTLPNTSDALIVNGTAQSNFPYNANLPGGNNWILDIWGTGYYSNTTDTIFISKNTQTSPDEQGNGSTTTGVFESVWINHGMAPSNKSYEFVILPNNNATTIANFHAEMQSPLNQPYQILQQDSFAHIVHHKNSDIYGYALFAANTSLNIHKIVRNDAPCLVMLKEVNGFLYLSLVDPTTSFSQNSLIELELDGEYSIHTADSDITITAVGGGKTTLVFAPKDGHPSDVVLKSNSNVLNSNFLVFTGTPTLDKRVRLKWQLANEANVNLYRVERSNNAINWKHLPPIVPSDNSLSYILHDEEPNNGYNYYRVKQVNLNESIHYSPIAVVEFKEEATIAVSPNPNQGTFQLFFNRYSEPYIIEVFTLVGLRVLTTTATHKKNTIRLPNLVAGIYVVRIKAGDRYYYKNINISK